jgi:LmbE family N-acetylglucosaminyl deacetylase
MKFKFSFLSLLIFSISLIAQNNNSSLIYHDLQKLNKLGRVLYLAAHPDDENTRLISYLANEEKVNTAYLSLTRGDGGQNLIGNEIGVLLGLIRTNELLEARKIDGGQQFFSSAYDFGFSKTADETIEFWGKEKILKEMVYIIRKFKPDVIINRFPITDDYGGHGHHKAASILSIEAFDLAADPKVYPDQVKELGTWKTERLLFNASTWWKADLATHYKDNPNFIRIDVGIYNPLLGISYPEMAGDSRTMHKSQGFGSLRAKGETEEYLEWLKGSKPKSTIFDNINTSWTRVAGGEEIGKKLEGILNTYDFTNPSKSLKAILELKTAILKIPQNDYTKEKIELLDNIITRILGLDIIWHTNDFLFTPGDYIKSNLEIIVRDNAFVKLKSYKIDTEIKVDTLLKNNEFYKKEIVFNTPQEIKYDQAFWLEKEKSFGYFNISEKDFFAAKKEALTKINVVLEIEGQQFSFEKNLKYRKVDPVKGELIKPVYIVPPFSIKPSSKNYIISDKSQNKISIEIQANSEIGDAKLFFNLPKGIQLEPSNVSISRIKKHEKRTFEFLIKSNIKTDNITIEPYISLAGMEFNQNMTYIDYDHIEPILYLEKATFNIKNPNLKISDKKIAYIMGSGDEVAKILNSLGYQVDILEDKDINLKNLQKYNVLICGIRAFNTRDVLSYTDKEIHQFVEQGGKLIVQYNVNRGLKTENIFPYNLKLSRNRVTEEDAKVEILDAKHPIMNSPNIIKQEDFDNWVQERGLYFAEEWDEKFSPLLGINDKNENIQPGSLLVANHGKGKVVFTGLSFFRQLPAGVNGAFKLFVNMIEY